MPRKLSIFFIIVASLLLLVTNIGVWVQTGIFDENRFVDITTGTFSDEDVRLAIAEGIVDAALEDRPLVLELVRDRASEVIAEILDSSIVQGIVELASRLAFDLLVYNDGKRVAINLEPIKDFIVQIVNIIDPAEADAIQTDQIPDEIVIIEEGDLPSLEKVAAWTSWSTLLIGLLSAGLFALVLWRGWSTANRNSYLKWIGGSVAIGAAILVALTLTAGSAVVLVIDNSTGETVISATYGNLVRQLQAQSLLLVIGGIAVWLVGWWFIRESRNSEPSADSAENAGADESESGDDLPEAEAAATM